MIDTASGCSQTLMPEGVTRTQRVAYLRKESYAGGATDHSFEHKDERVELPYIRQIDDIHSIIEEVSIWVSNNNPVCESFNKTNDVLTLEGLVHGREAIGLLKGPDDIDLDACSDDRPRSSEPSAGPEAARVSLVLGDVAYLESAEKTLPKWIGRSVQLVHGAELVTGRLKRYSRQTISIETSDGNTVDVHFMDALAIELVGQAPPAAAPSENRARPPECRTWRKELREL